jgi:hypothetical protein
MDILVMEFRMRGGKFGMARYCIYIFFCFLLFKYELHGRYLALIPWVHSKVLFSFLMHSEQANERYGNT